MNQPIQDAFFIGIINQIFDIEKKFKRISEVNTLGRNVEKLKHMFEEIGLVYHDPIGEGYGESRSDCEASISGTDTKNLSIVETIKPIIRRQNDGFTSLVQKAVVVVESKP
jgi:hypothetical protein